MNCYEWFSDISSVTTFLPSLQFVFLLTLCVLFIDSDNGLINNNGTVNLDASVLERGRQSRQSSTLCNFSSEHSDGFWANKSLPFLQSPPCCSWDEGSNDATCSADTPLHHRPIDIHIVQVGYV